MNRNFASRISLPVTVAAFIFLLLSAAFVTGQTAPDRPLRLPDPLPTTSGVSLTAEQITTLLKKDAGFTLYIKKLLVQKAYDQGRFLALQEFSDEDLYRLVSEDATIRTIPVTAS